MRKECAARDIAIEPIVCDGDRLEGSTVIPRITTSAAEAVVIYFDENPSILSAVAGLDRPVVLLAGQDPTMRVGSVGIGNRYGARLGVQYLLDLGHRDILLVTWPGRYTIRQREDGYREAIEGYSENSAREQSLVLTSFEPEIADRELFAWLTSNNGIGDITALFCLADNVAIGAIRALARFGLRVPDDISVLGFDDILAGQMMQPPLTTVHAPLTEIGGTALDELELHLRSRADYMPARRVELGCKIVERASCGRPRK